MDNEGIDQIGQIIKLDKATFIMSALTKNSRFKVSSGDLGTAFQMGMLSLQQAVSEAPYSILVCHRQFEFCYNSCRPLFCFGPEMAVRILHGSNSLLV